MYINEIYNLSWKYNNYYIEKLCINNNFIFKITFRLFLKKVSNFVLVQNYMDFDILFQVSCTFVFLYYLYALLYLFLLL